MEIDSPEYRLSSELHGHEDDVRGICICGEFGFATSSRDRTVRCWGLDQQSNKKHKYSSSKILLGHSSFVGPLAWIPPNDQFLEGGLVSGGMDTVVIVWDLKRGESVQTLRGHQLQVTGVALDGDDIVSSTIRRWRKGQCIEFWEAQKSAIQSVLKLPSGELVTGLDLPPKVIPPKTRNGPLLNKTYDWGHMKHYTLELKFDRLLEISIVICVDFSFQLRRQGWQQGETWKRTHEEREGRQPGVLLQI
ncbi:WD40 repeat [Dillenia turbinata]|uniref:WD40 repeat n=1 Tax=Dillenia turbinata TaxID=194707 RepID=A0AAN8ZTF4_9MAGN